MICPHCKQRIEEERPTISFTYLKIDGRDQKLIDCEKIGGFNKHTSRNGKSKDYYCRVVPVFKVEEK